MLVQKQILGMQVWAHDIAPSIQRLQDVRIKVEKRWGIAYNSSLLIEPKRASEMGR